MTQPGKQNIRLLFAACCVVALGACSSEKKCPYPAGPIVEQCIGELFHPQGCYAFQQLLRMTPDERRQFSAKHDCGHNPEQFATGCLHEAQGCTTDADCLVQMLEEVADSLPLFRNHTPSDMERATAASERIGSWLEAVKRDEQSRR